MAVTFENLQKLCVLSRWDAIKINSTYCPSQVGYADPRYGPCVVPRLNLLKWTEWIYKRRAIY
uniref:Uncharacterized protein n=1 Tax=Parascaris equorum TaxID=6256 RepID=A0A914RE69_PAREQ